MNSPKNIFLVLFISFIFVSVGININIASAESLVIDPSWYVFNRDLNLGSKGEDVFFLQKLLNQDSDTRIAISGPGSLGQETTYFGNLTKNAVIKYQNKYSSEILQPVGLTYGTGYFGPSTKNHIKNTAYGFNGEFKFETELSEQIKDLTQENINQPDQETEPKLEVNTNTTEPEAGFKIEYISQNVAEEKNEVVIISYGVNSNSKILLRKSGSTDKTVDASKIITNGIYFVVPKIDYGTYQVYVKNGTQLSDPVTMRIVGDVKPPQISSIVFSGDSIEYGETIIIKGERLSGQNTVMTLLGNYVVDSDNSSEIKFVVEKTDDMGGLEGFSGKILDGFIRIRNYNGDSNIKSVKFIYD